LRIEELSIPEQVKEVILESGISTLYPPQEEAVKAGALEGKNLVLASPTASGKTLLAELCAIKQIIESGGKVLYLTPLRALASEKYEVFKKYTGLEKSGGRRVSVAISTGDYDRSDHWLGRYDVIIVTNEKCDSLLRHKADWVGRVTLVVADEVHILNDRDRGPTLEVTLTRLREINPELQILVLSATIRNADEVAEWLEADSITTEWRPVKLIEGVYLDGECLFNDGSSIKVIRKNGESPAINLATYEVNRGGQALIFAETRRRAVSYARRAAPVVSKYISSSEKRALNSVARRILAAGERTGVGDLLAELSKSGVAFHHAGLSCLPSGTLITLWNGEQKRIEAIKPTEYVVSLDQRTMRFEKGKVLSVWRSGLKRIFRLKTLTGREVVASGNHPFLRIGNEGTSWIPLEQLEIGEFVAIPKILRCEAEETPLFVSLLQRETYVVDANDVFRRAVSEIKTRFRTEIKDLAESYGIKERTFYGYAGDGSIPLNLFIQLCGKYGLTIKEAASNIRRIKAKRGSALNIPKYVTRSFMRIVGYITANGTVDRRGDIRFENHDEDVVKDFALIILENFGLNLQVEKSGESNSFHLRFRCKPLADLLIECFGSSHGKKVASWKIPNLTHRMPDEYVAELLSGIMCEAYVGSRGVELNLSDESLIRKIQGLLQRFGVVSSINPIESGGGKPKYDGKTVISTHKGWRLLINDYEGLVNVAKHMGLVGKNAEKMRQIISEKRKKIYNTHVTPNTFPNVKVLTEKCTPPPSIGLTPATVSRVERSLKKSASNPQKLTPAMRSLEIENSSFHGDTPSEDIYWDKVDDITECGLADVWDLKVDRENFVAENIVVHNSAHRKIVEDCFRGGKIKVISATPTLASGVNLPARMVVISSYQRYDVGYGRLPITVLEYKQMAGRAGRPQYDKTGEAALISKKEDEKNYLMQSYVLAKPERIWSKLAVESVLRSHVLASIASGFTRSEQGLLDFFDKTFYAHQYGSNLIQPLVGKALLFLERENMIEFMEKTLEATDFGRRVSKLYIDPVSAVILRDGMSRRPAIITDFSLLHLVCHTPDIYPKYYPRRSEVDELSAYAATHSEEFMTPIPDEAEIVDYEMFLGEVKRARVLEAWIEETSENEILEKHSFQTGDLFRLIRTADWLLYASSELGRLFNRRDLLPRISSSRARVRMGVEKELLPIVNLQGIGRVRGRILFNSGFKTIKDLKRATPSQLTSLPMIGPRLVKKIKEQTGGLMKEGEWEALKEGKREGQKSLLEY
jgi:replicative superfamily II helicase/intein/homing endonuclease